MRLKNLTGFDIGPLNTASADSESSVCRVVVYTADQLQAVYISEDFTPNCQSKTELKNVDFEYSAQRHAYLIAVQLLVRQDAKEQPEWTIQRDWTIDLRGLEPEEFVKNETELTLRSFGGLVPVKAAKHLTDDPANARTNTDTHSNDEVPPDTQPNGTNSQQPNNNIENQNYDSTAGWLFGWGKALNRKINQQPEKVLCSLSYPTLIDLWTLTHSIDDARDASLIFEQDSDEIIPHSTLVLQEKRQILERRLQRIRTAAKNTRLKAERVNVETQNKRDKSQRTNSELDSSFQATRTDAASAADSDFTIKQKHINQLGERIKTEQGRLAAELLEVFPIEPVGDGKFHFSIHGLMLPSVFAMNHYDTTQIGAALGFVAQVVVCISRYLDTALPYPITIFGSQSYITDNISVIKHGSTNFPLWTRGVLLYRVEYALYLLHKDIEQLMTLVNLAVVDLKQTLANLKNLLLVISSYR